MMDTTDKTGQEGSSENINDIQEENKEYERVATKKAKSSSKKSPESSVIDEVYEKVGAKLGMSKEEIEATHETFMKTLNFGWGDSKKTPSVSEFLDEYLEKGISGLMDKLRGPDGKKNPLSELLVKMAIGDPNIEENTKEASSKKEPEDLQNEVQAGSIERPVDQETSTKEDPSLSFDSSDTDQDDSSESKVDAPFQMGLGSFNAFKLRKEFSEFLKSKYGDSIGLKKVNTELNNENFPDIKGFSLELEVKPRPDGTIPPVPTDLDVEFKKYLQSKYKGVDVLSIPIRKEGESGFEDIFSRGDPSSVIPDFSRRREEARKKKARAASTTKKIDYKNFNYTPKEIKAYLDRFVIKQDEAKKALAIAVCDHYNHVKECINNPQALESEYAKQNVLILGPTGVGKTYLIKQIAKLIGVPFVKADATRFSETGYVGANVDDLVTDLVQQAGGDVDIAQYGIIYLDEADKLATKSAEGSKDVSGRGVQFGLLKLMEETEVDLRSNHDMRSQLQSFMEFQRTGKIAKKVINTRHILFIISGSFNYLADIIKKRLNQNSIGFANEVYSFQNKDDYFVYASTADFVEFGFEPEFIGRLPVRVSCSSLSAEDLYSILKNSEGSIIKQYKTSFKNYGIDIDFEDEALRRIAELAYLEKTGARSLMTVCERIFRDYKFELPSSKITTLTVSPYLVDHPEEVLRSLLETSSDGDLN